VASEPVEERFPQKGQKHQRGSHAELDEIAGGEPYWVTKVHYSTST